MKKPDGYPRDMHPALATQIIDSFVVVTAFSLLMVAAGIIWLYDLHQEAKLERRRRMAGKNA